MLCISTRDIVNTVSLTELVDAIESAYFINEEGSFFMPDRMHINYSDNTLLLMPCFTKDRFATKMVSLFPENTKQNIPVLYGSVILNDGSTGEPLAILNGAKLTAMRTGAVGGAAIRWLGINNSKSIGIIGAGVQGIHQAIFAINESNATDINVFDPNPDSKKKFISGVNSFYKNVNINFYKSPEEILEKSDNIIMSTTATKPVLPENHNILKGKCYIAIGSYKPELKELPESLFKLIDQYFIDTEHAMTESGDLITPINKKWFKKENIHSIGKLITSNIELSSNTTRLFKSVGMALFDLVVADLIYKRAVEKGIGTKVDF